MVYIRKNNLSIALLLFFFSGFYHSVYASGFAIGNKSGVTVGKEFIVPITVSVDNPVNAITATIKYDNKNLRLKRFDTTNSIIQMWVDIPKIQKSINSIDVGGIILNPGFTGHNGKLISLVFEPLISGNTKVSISSGSILLNDGLGTALDVTLSDSIFNVQTSSSLEQTKTTSNELMTSSKRETSTSNSNNFDFIVYDRPDDSYPFITTKFTGKTDKKYNYRILLNGNTISQKQVTLPYVYTIKTPTTGTYTATAILYDINNNTELFRTTKNINIKNTDSPIITSFSDIISHNSPFILHGTTLQNAQVTANISSFEFIPDSSISASVITSQKDSSKALYTYNTKADENGNFSIEYTKPLNPGKYNISINSVDEYGGMSTPYRSSFWVRQDNQFVFIHYFFTYQTTAIILLMIILGYYWWFVMIKNKHL